MDLDESNYGQLCSTPNILSTNYVGRESIVDTRREKPKVRRKNQNFAQKKFLDLGQKIKCLFELESHPLWDCFIEF